MVMWNMKPYQGLVNKYEFNYELQILETAVLFECMLHIMYLITGA